MKNKITTIEIEARLAGHFNYRQNLIVPNISWGMDIHECDLLIVTKSGYATEVEIKISRADLKKDAFKKHNHEDRFNRIRRLYFAIPESLSNCIEFIPERAGIIVLSRGKNYGEDYLFCKVLREAKINTTCKQFTEAERFNVARLGAMRIWGLKRKIITMRKNPIPTLPLGKGKEEEEREMDKKFNIQP